MGGFKKRFCSGSVAGQSWDRSCSDIYQNISEILDVSEAVTGLVIIKEKGLQPIISAYRNVRVWD